MDTRVLDSLAVSPRAPRRWNSLRRTRKKSPLPEKKQLPFKKSMFGATLEEVMDLQKESHPNHHLPWVLTLLADKVILYGGYSTEGIFRVPGDIDKVCSLKVCLDNGEHVSEFPTTDAPVCA